MPKRETVLSVFVASPEDVSEERDSIEDIINELNAVWSKTFQTRLELIKWDTHTYPGKGIDAQDVINQQIEDYDIFIGIMWQRLGTPTQRADSGTTEEYERALTRHNDDPTSIKLFFYFKEAPIPPFSTDLDQLKKVVEFRKRLEGIGQQYRTFNDKDDFSTQVRMHLSMVVREFSRVQSSVEETTVNTRPAESEPQKKNEEGENDEAGFIDLIEDALKYFAELGLIMKRIAEEQTKLTGRITQNTEEITNAKGMGDRKSYINRVAADMDEFSDFLEKQLPLYSDYYTKGSNSFIKSITLFSEFKVEGKEASTVLETLIESKGALVKLNSQISELQSVISSLPRITTDFNKAKRRSLSVLGDFVARMTKSIGLSEDIQKALEAYCSEGK